MRRLVTAEIVAVGSELTVGETRDTNSGELAANLTAEGVVVGRLTALPDVLDVVRGALASGLERSDLILVTGGLGPTPDDLTREAIAALLGETPAVDPGLESWLRALWARRGIPFPTLNLKQAWLIPSATAIPNPNGTAPGWWVDAPDGKVIVALPGPPREMRPMWRDSILPRLRERGLGQPVVIRTLRLAGIGESQLADLLGELLHAANPIVATYARADAVDVRIAARPPADPSPDGRAAAEALADSTEQRVLELVGRHVWARGDTSWAAAIGAEIGATGGSLGVVEYGTGGSLSALLGDAPWVAYAERHPSPAPSVRSLRDAARRIADGESVPLVVAVSARPRRGDTVVSLAVLTPEGERRERRLVFLDGAPGRTRAALAAADALLAALRSASAARPAR